MTLRFAQDYSPPVADTEATGIGLLSESGEWPQTQSCGFFIAQSSCFQWRAGQEPQQCGPELSPVDQLLSRSATPIGLGVTENKPVHESTQMNTNTPAVFNFNSNEVRTVTKDGEPWFVASDVCAALGYQNTSKAVGDHLDDDERASAMVPTPNAPLGVPTNIINESGLYALVLRSRKPEARKFAKWVTKEVLPAIRKTGSYSVAISREQAGEIVTRMAERFPNGADRPYAWSRFNNHFRLASYRDLPSSKYLEALRYIGTMEPKHNKLEENMPALEVRRAMLSGLSLPEVDAPESIEKAIKEKAISMAFEAYEIAIEHIKRRVAFNCEYGQPRKLDEEKAIGLIKKISLSESLTHVYYSRITSLEKTAYHAMTIAKEFMDDISGIKSGKLKSGELSGIMGEIQRSATAGALHQ
ncbi:BRO family protein [Azonexus sp. IMCC34839]|uniref:BRO family protein n=1 Tax=Azonexus sp. IMCC34839 TaxID=3133695 RepID=UPI00399BECAC